MIAKIFLAIQLVLRLFKLWDSFLVYADEARERERLERDRKRDAAVDKQKHSQTEEEFDKAQDDIAGNRPRP